MSDIQKKKQRHIELALDRQAQGSNSVWEKYELSYKALPDLDLDVVSTEKMLLGKKLQQPLIIASMTGGSKDGEKINRNLAMAVEERGVALGVGSQRVALEKKEALKSFSVVRQYAPTTVVFANMAAVQLNYEYGVDKYRQVAEMVEADGLYLHLNPLQEAMNIEGDTNFSRLLAKIEKLVEKVGVPVWVKEVGHGLDVETAQKLVEVGVQGIDVAGRGGTSWAWIEAVRNKKDVFAEWFKDVGFDTDVLVKAVADLNLDISLVASGGVRNPVDGLKALLLGADYYSAAHPFLEPAMTSAEEVVELLKEWQKGLQVAMFVSGMRKLGLVEKTDI